MAPRFVAAVGGVGIGLGLGITVGVVTAVALTMVGWPGPNGEPTDRARHLGESISQGMHVALIAAVVLAPVGAVILARRHPRAR